MYLSRLLLNPKSRLVRELQADVYQQHVTLWRAWRDRNPGRVLFCIEADGSILRAIVQNTGDLPDWDFWNMEPFRGCLLATSETNPAIKEIPGLNLQRGDVVTFKVRANPTYRDDQGKRRTILDDEAQRVWLQQVAYHTGLNLIYFNTINEGIVVGTHPNQAQPIQVGVCTYQGVARVSDPEAVWRKCQQGIGPAKAFGCGLLSLARA